MEEIMDIRYYTALPPGLQQPVCQLAACCRAHDNSSLSYPLPPEEGVLRHYLAFGSPQKLVGALAVISWDEDTVEIAAFTQPEERKKGFFSKLLALALADFKDYEILFAAPFGCRDTMYTLNALGAEHSHDEHQMEFSLSQNRLPGFPPPPQKPATLVPPRDILSPGARWMLLSGHTPDSPVGTCLTSPVSPSCLCLHQVMVPRKLRGQGFGSLLVYELIRHLETTEFLRLILHVSGDNAPALALYKKAGFRITETLSYYCY